MAYIASKFPELVLMLDLHDGIWYSIPDDEHTEELAIEARNSLNKVNFAEIWGVDDVVKYTFDAQLGDNFLNVREL